MPASTTQLRLESLHLHNFRGFEHLELSFHPRLNVLIGINGAGKTAILEGLSQLLQLYLSVLEPGGPAAEAPVGNFPSSDLRNGTTSGSAALKVRIEFVERRYEEDAAADDDAAAPYEEVVRIERPYWRVGLHRRGFELDGEGSDFDALTALGLEMRRKMLRRQQSAAVEARSLPIVAFFPSNVALPRPQVGTGRIPESAADWFQALDHALDGAAFDLPAFFQWFRWLQSKNRNAQEEAWFSTLRQVAVRMLNGAQGHLYDDLQVDWEEALEGELALVKNGLKVRISQLSEGEKRLLLLSINLAYRLILANPDAPEPLRTGTGIVLIDEIDLHLHPLWELRVIPRLVDLFPGIQFVLTTHSEAVLFHLDRDCIFKLQDGQLLDPARNPYTKGRSLEEISIDAFGLHPDQELTPELVALQDKVNACYDLLDADEPSPDDLVQAKQLIDDIRSVKGPNDRDVYQLTQILELMTTT